MSTENENPSLNLDDYTVRSHSHSKTMRLDILPDTSDSQIIPHVVVHADQQKGISMTLEELRSLFKEAYDATLITDMNGEILQSNQRAHEFLGTSGKSLIGMNITNIISGADSDMVAKVANTLATERYVRIHAWCHSGNGSFFPTEIAVHKSVALYAKHLCFFIRDITWRKEAEDRLQIVDTAMRTARAGIAMLDVDTRITYANPALNMLCGLPMEQNLVGRNMSEFFEDQTKMAIIAEHVASGNSWGGQINITRFCDRQSVTMDCEAAPACDTDGDIIGAVLSFADITDTIRAQDAERTIERNRVMMESIGSVCHHLGQPSTILLNSLEMLQKLDESDKETRNELLALSLSAAESLGALLRELNDLRTYRAENYANASSIVSLTQEKQAEHGQLSGDDYIG